MRLSLFTVVETEVYLRSAERLMSEVERAAVVDYFAANPQAGDVTLVLAGFAKLACRWPVVASVAEPG